MTDLVNKLGDLRKNDASAQSEVYIQIECQRITNIITTTAQELQIALCLPVLIEDDFKFLGTILSQSELEMAKITLLQYTQLAQEDTEANRRISQFYASSASSFEQFVNQYEIRNPPFGSRKNPQLCHLVEVILSNPNVIEFCRNDINGMLLSGAAQNLINDVDKLIYYINERMKISPQNAVLKEIELSEMFKDNELTKENIEEIKNNIKKQSLENAQIIKQLDSQILKITEEINDIKMASNEKVKQFYEEAEKKMLWDWNNSEYRQEQLTIDAKQSVIDLDTLLKKNQLTEKGLLSKRYKLESQVVAQVDKYDTDKFDRTDTLNNLKATYKKQEEDLQIYQEIFDDQEREYNELMGEKADYEMQILEEKLYVVQCSIAARKIQRYFRYYRDLQRQYGKPIKKKGKKKKKK